MSEPAEKVYPPSPAELRAQENASALEVFEPKTVGILRRFVGTANGHATYLRYAQRHGFDTHNLKAAGGYMLQQLHRLQDALLSGAAPAKEAAAATDGEGLADLRRQLLDMHRRVVAIESISVVKAGLPRKDKAPADKTTSTP